MLPVLVALFLQSPSSGNCSGEVDKYTALTKCEMHELARQVENYEKAHPAPDRVVLLDSIIAYHDSVSEALDAQRIALLRSYKYNSVCNVCFENHLACGNRKAGSLEFTCINEGRLLK